MYSCVRTMAKVLQASLISMAAELAIQLSLEAAIKLSRSHRIGMKMWIAR
jgi:hypothetical protein